MSMPIVVGGRVFTVEEPHTLVCVDADKGRVLWRKANDHLETFPASKQARARELLASIDNDWNVRRSLLHEHQWLRGSPLSTEVLFGPQDAKPKLQSDDPADLKRLAEIEAIWLREGWSRNRDKDGKPTAATPVNPVNFGHGYVVFDKDSPRFAAFYTAALRELLVDYGIAPLIDHTGLVMMNSGQTQATPVSDGTFVYVNFGQGHTVCYALDGNRKWMVWHPHNLGEGIRANYGADGGWGTHLGDLLGLTGSSPVLVGDTVITSQGMAVRALDKTTGALRWEYLFPRASGSNRSYGTPAVMQLAGGRKVLVCPQGAILDAKTGKELSGITEAFGFFQVPYGNTHCAIVDSPVVDGDRFFVTWAMGAAAYRVVPEGLNKVSVKQLWLAVRPAKRSPDDPAMEMDHQNYLKQPRTLGPETFYLSSPLYDAARNRIYLSPHLARKVYAFDADTGEPAGEASIPPGARDGLDGISNERVSPALVGEKYLYAARSDGSCTVFDADDLSAVSAHNRVLLQYMRDAQSHRDGYPRDPAHKRVPWEIMKRRWIDAGFNVWMAHAWPTETNVAAVYRDPFFQEDRVYIRGNDALYCLQTGARDTAPPSVPAGLTTTTLQRDGGQVVQLRWEESTDNVRVAAYRVSVNGQEQRRVGYPLAELPITPGQKLTLQIIAEDGSGNLSEPSAEYPAP